MKIKKSLLFLMLPALLLASCGSNDGYISCSNLAVDGVSHSNSTTYVTIGVYNHSNINIYEIPVLLLTSQEQDESTYTDVIANFHYKNNGPTRQYYLNLIGVYKYEVSTRYYFNSSERTVKRVNQISKRGYSGEIDKYPTYAYIPTYYLGMPMIDCDENNNTSAGWANDWVRNDIRYIKEGTDTQYTSLSSDSVVTYTIQ